MDLMPNGTPVELKDFGPNPPTGTVTGHGYIQRRDQRMPRVMYLVELDCLYQRWLPGGKVFVSVIPVHPSNVQRLVR